RRARRIGLAEGLRFVDTGNVHHRDGDTTRCPGCGRAVVVRDWYAMRHYGLTDSGCCEQCGTQLPGVYDGPVGTWGARRLPVVLRERGWPVATATIDLCAAAGVREIVD